MPRPPPLISLRSASFRLSPTSPLLFPNTTFTLPSSSVPPQKWTVLGPSKSTFLSILRGSHLATPPNSRLYPYLAEKNKWPQSAIQLVSFGAGSSSSGMLKGGTGGDGYISARYETLRETFDQTVGEWLEDAIERVNPYSDQSSAAQEAEEAEAAKRLLNAVAEDLKLSDLMAQAVMTLSNGQSRRARIAQALLKRPEVLIVDEPFMGLDPPNHRLLSELLDRISTPKEGGSGSAMPVVLGLRPQDPVPEWITHLAYVENDKVMAMGDKEQVVAEAKEQGKRILLHGEKAEAEGVVEKVWAGFGVGEDKSAASTPEKESTAEPLVEMNNVRIAYYENVILDNFSWTIRRGEQWGLFGPNGSGKTTITSLLTSDHPLTYSLPIRHFGRPRLPQVGTPGISVFEIQARIGIASPELHAFFPRQFSLRRAVLSGFAETFLSKPQLSAEEQAHVDAVLEKFKDLVPSWDEEFGSVDLSTQRMVLFLRATVPRRDLVVYDEAFSGMRKEVRERCFEFLETPQGWNGERQAMVVVSHVSEEVPKGVERWVRLGEKGGKEAAKFGVF